MSASPSLSPEQLPREDRREHRIKQFETYRNEDKHECGLLVTRSASLLTSQSFLVAAVALFYRPGSQADERFLIPIACLAFLIAISASFAICVGCKVLQMWHAYGNALILEDNGKRRKEANPLPDNFLHGLYLPPREQPDWRHMVSIDAFHLAMPVIFGAAWATFLWFNTHGWGRSLILAVVVVWVFLLGLAWVRADKGFDPKPEEFR